jgi:hypothetical protein
VVGGWSSGFVTWLFVVGPLRLERDNGRLVPRFNRDAALWGGLAAMAPPEGGATNPARLPSQMLRVVAGGPLASLLLALLLVPGLAMKQESRTFAFVLIITGFTSLAIAAATLVPHRAGGFLSDGARIRQLLRASDESRLWCAVAAVGSVASTLRPRHWPEDLIPSLRGPGSSLDRVMAQWLLHAWHMDREEWDLAEDALHQALAGMSCAGAAMRSLVHASAALHYALRVNPSAARAHFTSVASGAFFKPGDRDAIEAAVLAAEGRREESLARATHAESRLAGRSGVQAELYREILREVRSRTLRDQLA